MSSRHPSGAPNNNPAMVSSRHPSGARGAEVKGLMCPNPTLALALIITLTQADVWAGFDGTFGEVGKQCELYRLMTNLACFNMMGPRWRGVAPEVVRDAINDKDKLMAYERHQMVRYGGSNPNPNPNPNTRW